MDARPAVLLLLAALPWAQLDAEQRVRSNFRVSATVGANCDVLGSDVDFGAYNARGGSHLHGAPLLKATCSPGASYQIAISEGRAPGATVNQRAMVSSTSNSALQYQLYSDSPRGIVWGNAQSASTVTGVGTGLPQDHAVFGTVPPAQFVPPEPHSDIITVRIFY